ATRFSGQMIPAVDFIWTSLTGTSAKVPIVWVYISVPIGSALLIIHMLVSLFFDARKVFARTDEGASAPDGA
ncbi:MAG: hypothetical protein OEQ29_21755, partial [Alphaproteobacteria bacterium]|nr:hypothetical protein [Alphaproteobacteria bacterium]